MIPLFCVRMLSDAVTATTLCVVLYDATTDFGRLVSSIFGPRPATHEFYNSSVKLVKTLIMYAINRFVLTTYV